MVGRVRVRGQGPVRRGQTTTTFKKGGRVKKQLGGVMPGGAAGVQRPLAVAGAAGVQRPLAGGVRPGARMVKKGGSIKKAKGGRVKLMHGGRPSARTRHIENEKEEIRRVDRNIRRNEGYKTGGRVKKARGGALKMARTLSDTIGKDIKDSRKKLNVHQDPRSGLSAALRHMRDNPPKKKPRNIHTDPKKRTLKDKYLKHLQKSPRKPRAKGVPRPVLGRPGPGVSTRRTRPTPRNK